MKFKKSKMRNYNLIAIISLVLFSVGCGNGKNSEELFFSFDNSKVKEQYQPQETVNLDVKNIKNKKIDSIVYYINDKKSETKKGTTHFNFNLSHQKLGYQNIKALVYYEGNNQEISTRIELVSNTDPKILKYKIVATYPHDTLSFTEGFEFYKDTLYESTGSPDNGIGYLRKYDLKTGLVYKQVNLDKKYFGEGITILNDKVYQLTWQSNVGFIYNSKTFAKEKEFPFDKKIEGWGMTNDGMNLYQSDGTEKIWKMNPTTQKMTDCINVYTSSGKVKSINELEYIDGKIYCNVWQKDVILIVNSASGAVEGIVNFADIRKLVTNKKAEVLNGIAYNPKSKSIFITGKNWNKTFEIKIVE